MGHKVEYFTGVYLLIWINVLIYLDLTHIRFTDPCVFSVNDNYDDGTDLLGKIVVLYTLITVLVKYQSIQLCLCL